MNDDNEQPTYEQCEGAFLGAKSPAEGIEAIRRLCILTRPQGDSRKPLMPIRQGPSMFAVAQQDGLDRSAFWAGPSQSLDSLLGLSGMDSASVIVSLGDHGNTVVASWNVLTGRWDLTN